MSSGLGAQPTATTLDVEQLAKWAKEGRIRIPHFQRSLRWQRDDVIKLFDSIVRGYPVGSLLLWHRAAPEETLQLGALRIAAPEMSDALWVVDGQQRITSLANALHPDGQLDERFRISYDLRKKLFVPTPKDSEASIIPLPVIFDLREVLRWFASHPEAIDYVDEANEITRTVRQFKIPAYEVSEEDPEVLKIIFDRMNNYGKRLTRAEIFSALFSKEEGAESGAAATLDRIAQKISDNLGFGLIDNDTIHQAILARRGPDVRRGVRSEFGESTHASASGRHQRARAIIDFPDEDQESALALGESTIRDAVSFLQNEVGVPHFTLLPYKYLLVVLARLFAHYQDLDERSRQLVRRWFWRAAIVGPGLFRGGTSGAVWRMNSAIKPGDLEGSISRLLALLPESAARVPDLKRFRSNEASTKIVLCSWWSREPRSLRTGELFEISDLSRCIDEDRAPLVAIQYIVSRYSVPRELRLWAANRTLYPDSSWDEGPLEILLSRLDGQEILSSSDWGRTALDSYGITLEMLLSLDTGRVEDFLATRQEVLERQLGIFLGQRCEWEFEDTPPLDSLVLDDEAEAEELSDDSS